MATKTGMNLKMNRDDAETLLCAIYTHSEAIAKDARRNPELKADRARLTKLEKRLLTMLRKAGQ
jgi:hypothetical protein